MSVPKRTAGVLSEVVDDIALVLSPDGQRLITLNRTGAVIWEAVDGHRDIAGLADELAMRVEIERSQLENDVATFVAALEQTGLVVFSDASD